MFDFFFYLSFRLTSDTVVQFFLLINFTSYAHIIHFLFFITRINTYSIMFMWVFCVGPLTSLVSTECGDLLDPTWLLQYQTSIVWCRRVDFSSVDPWYMLSRKKKNIHRFNDPLSLFFSKTPFTGLSETRWPCFLSSFMALRLFYFFVEGILEKIKKKLEKTAIRVVEIEGHISL